MPHNFFILHSYKTPTFEWPTIWVDATVTISKHSNFQYTVSEGITKSAFHFEIAISSAFGWSLYPTCQHKEKSKSIIRVIICGHPNGIDSEYQVQASQTVFYMGSYREHYKVGALQDKCRQSWPKSEIGKSYTPFSHFRCLSCIQNHISLHISSQLQNADESNQNQTDKLLQVTGSFWYLYKFAQLKLEALFDHVQEMLDNIKEVFLLCLFLTCASLLYMFETAEHSYS